MDLTNILLETNQLCIIQKSKEKKKHKRSLLSLTNKHIVTQKDQITFKFSSLQSGHNLWLLKIPFFFSLSYAPTCWWSSHILKIPQTKSHSHAFHNQQHANPYFINTINSQKATSLRYIQWTFHKFKTSPMETNNTTL